MRELRRIHRGLPLLYHAVATPLFQGVFEQRLLGVHSSVVHYNIDGTRSG